MGAVAISNIMYTALHSFYPIYIEENFPALRTIHFSIILATFEVANLATSLILGMYMTKLKRKNLIIGSNVLLMTATLAFPLLTYFAVPGDGYLLTAGNGHIWFFALSVILRIFQGIASASIQICAYSFATNEMRDKKEVYIGYVEMSLGVGDVIGPAIGGLLFSVIGFSATFLAFGSMIAIGIVLSITSIPETLNQVAQYEEEVDPITAMIDQGRSRSSSPRAIGGEFDNPRH